MHRKKRSGTSTDSGKFVFWLSSRRPARVLIVEASPPWWSDTCKVLCDALDDFLSLACSLDGPCRIPLLSLYAISRQQECLLPFAVRLWKQNINRFFCAFLFMISFILVYHSRFVGTCWGWGHAWKSWGWFLQKVASERQQGQETCCSRQCLTVCSSSSSTWATEALQTTTHPWRWGWEIRDY